MTLKSVTLTSGCLATLFAVVAILTLVNLPRHGAPDEETALPIGVSSSSMEVRLYSPPRTAAADYLERSDILHFLPGDCGRRFEHYHSGTTVDGSFCGDRLLASKEFFPADEGGSRQLRSEAIFDAVGEPGHEIYKNHQVLRREGTIERKGERLPDGGYRQTYMFEDGITPRSELHFDALLNFTSETIYRWKTDLSGTYVYASLVPGYPFTSMLSVRLYREDGTCFAAIKQGLGFTAGTFLAPDGKTAIAEWSQDMNYSSYVTLSGDARTLTGEWLSSLGSTRVMLRDPENLTLVLVQFWKERPDPSQPGGKRYLLRSAWQYDRLTGRQVMHVIMSMDGSHPTEVIIPGKDNDVARLLDESGKVLSVEKREGTSAFVVDPASSSLKAIKADPGGTLTIDPLLLKMPEHPLIPTFDASDPPQIYDYD